MSDDTPELGDVVDFDPEQETERKWIVLFEEDYENHIVDVADSVGVLVNCNQACELLRLASKTVFELAPEHAPEKEPIEAMIDELEDLRDEQTE